MDKTFKEMKDWSIKLGLHSVKDPVFTCEEITDLYVDSLNSITLDQLEDLMLRISSYNIYLKSRKGSLEAQIAIIKHELNKKLFLMTNNLGSDYKFKTIDEKDAIVQSMYPDIAEQKRQLSLLQAKLLRIKDIPYAIDKKLELIKLTYQRRRDESKS